MAETKLGKIAMTPKGAWDASTVYEKLDVVRHNGGSWLSKQANTNVEPVEGEYWTAVTEKQLDDSTVEKNTAWSSKNIIDRLCPEVTATGNPAVLEDIVEGYPMDIAASWDIQQEGEGEPHLEGYGKNLLDITKCSTTSSAYGVTPSISGDMVVLTGTASGIGNYSFMAIVKTPDYTLSGKGYVVTAFPTKGTIPRIYGLRTETENAIAIRLPTYADGDVVDIRFRIMVSVDTPTEYESYAANIRPFVGRDSVTVNRYGKNLWKWGDVEGKSAGNFGYPSIVDATDFPDELVNTPITFKCFDYVGQSEDNAHNYVAFYDVFRNMIVNTYRSPTVTLSTKPAYFYFYAGSKPTSGTVPDAHFRKIMLVAGSTVPTEYEPYTAPTTATLALPETVYGGSVDTDGKGKKTHIVRAIADMLQNQNGNPSEKTWLTAYAATAEDYIKSAKHLSNVFRTVNWDKIVDEKTITYPFVWYATVSFGIAVPKSLLGVADDYVPASDSEAVRLIKDWLGTITPTPMWEAELETPAAFTVTPAAIPALQTNTIITDADTITATARKDPIKTITNLTDRVAALEAAATNIEEV